MDNYIRIRYDTDITKFINIIYNNSHLVKLDDYSSPEEIVRVKIHNKREELQRDDGKSHYVNDFDYLAVYVGKYSNMNKKKHSSPPRLLTILPSVCFSCNSSGKLCRNVFKHKIDLDFSYKFVYCSSWTTLDIGRCIHRSMVY